VGGGCTDADVIVWCKTSLLSDLWSINVDPGSGGL
jgi:hypothetical protein